MLNSPSYMHVPDGMLSPLTSLIMFLLVLPFWYKGARGLSKRVNARNVPLIALMAAFSFIVMMFNVPLPGGTSGHAVAGALVAIILGPGVATIAISIALVIQAIFFGDGGILQIGANCFNMAVVLPYVAYGIYSLISTNSSVTSVRRVIGAALGGWVGLTVAALVTAVEFGLQPLLWHAADGTPLYAPYPLNVAIPAMVIPHLLVASVIEGLVGAAVVLYLQRANPAILQLFTKQTVATGTVAPGRLRLLWIGLLALIVATPLGLLAPGTAWGEWSADELSRMGLGIVPQGMSTMQGLWGAPLADYGIPALGNTSLGYVLSAVAGVGLIVVVSWLLSRLLAGMTRSQKPAVPALQESEQK